MTHYMYDLRDMLCEELDEIAKKQELTAGSLETVDKLTHSIKSIDTILAMENGGYSNDSGNPYRYDGGYSRYDGGYSGARGRNDRTGRYVSRGYSRRDGYSRADAKEHMMAELEDLMSTATDEKTKEAIRRAMQEIER